MKTIKLIALLTLSLCAAGYLLLGGTFGNVIDTAWRNTAEAAESAIPLEFELDMVETQLAGAGSSLDQQRQRVAELEVACQDLRREVLELEDEERRATGQLRELTDAYEATGMGARPAVLGGRQLRPVQVAADLRVASSRTGQIRRELELKRDLLARREVALEQGRTAVTRFVMQQQELRIALESRRMDLESTKLMAEVLTVPDATGSLAQVEKRLDEVGRKIRVARARAEAQSGDVAVDLPAVPAEEAYQEALAVLGAVSSVEESSRFGR